MHLLQSVLSAAFQIELSEKGIILVGFFKISIPTNHIHIIHIIIIELYSDN